MHICRTAQLTGMVLVLAIAVGCQSKTKTPPAANDPGARSQGAASGNKDAASAKGAAATPVAGTQPAAATQPTAPGEMLRPAGDGPNYARERFRLVSESDEIVSMLENGMTVIARRVPSPVSSVRAYVYTGGIYEGRWLGGGLSHLLEHLVAGGSTANRTEAENRNLLQSLGNVSNAYTTTDHTAYFINTTNDRMEQAVDLVAGWMLGAKITPPEFQRERMVVQRELEMGKGEPARVFYYLSQSNRYRVSPARIPVIGYQQVIQNLSRDDVYEYYKLTYQPNNMVFAIAGDVDPEKMLAAVQKHVKHAAPGRAFSRDIPAEPPVVSPRTVVGTFPKLGNAKLQLAFPSIRLDHPDLYALDLLAGVLGGGESSLFVETLRDEKRLVSDISVGSNTPNYVEGSFQIDMDVAPDKIADATAAALALLEEIKKPGGLTPERIARAKTLAKANHVKQMQTSEDIGGMMATDFMMTGDPHFSARYVERIDAVTAEQLAAVANRYINKNVLVTTALLPEEFVGAAGLPKAEDLLRGAGAAGATTKPAGATGESPVSRIELDDGTVLLHKRIATSPLVVIQTYALGGVTHEDEKTNGLGNLTMEMLARGTKTKSAKEVAEFWDSIGGDFAASCDRNTWSWKAQCLKADFPKAIEFYTDLMANPAFADAELTAMKERVAQQIKQQDAVWYMAAFRFFRQTYYGPMKSPYQYTPIGTEQNVQGFTAEQARDWYANKVLPSPRVMSIYGDVSREDAEKLVRQHLGKAKLPKAPAIQPVRIPAERGVAANEGVPSVTVERVEVNSSKQALAGVVVGFRADSVLGDPINYPIAVGDTMASGWTYGAGYLHELLRGMGLVYVVHAVNQPGRSADLPGVFVVYAGCEPTKVDEVVNIILENIARLQGEPADVNEQWFARAKDLAVVSEALNNEAPAAQAAQAAVDELLGLGYNWHQQFAGKVQAVSLPEVRSVARQRLAKCVVTVTTPAPDAVTIKPGRMEFRKFRPVDLTPRGVVHDAAGGG